jgi:hypothetical protein
MDLRHTLRELEARRVSLIAMSGMAFDLGTVTGRMLATVLAGIAEFERDLLRERVRSGLAAARARGKVLRRRPGQRPKSDRLAPKVLALVARAQLSADRQGTGPEPRTRWRGSSSGTGRQMGRSLPGCPLNVALRPSCVVPPSVVGRLNHSGEPERFP